jgi:2-polyprenyl-3-methyl-5-hydroxy-6-metoxy-1,4-benzoquinol methylase
MIQAHPVPSDKEIAAYYASPYYDPYLEAKRENVTAYEAWLDEIDKRSPRGSLLDVGCGLGLFLSAARARGWDARGVEPSVWPARFARDETGVPVDACSLEEARLPTGRFDVVTLWSTLEHLPDPVSVLREVARITRPGGMIWIGVPNTASLEARLRGARDHNLAKPEHLLHFTEHTLRRFLTGRIGLVDVERVYLWGDRRGFLRNAAKHLARRTNLGSEIRVVARKSA